MSYPDNKIRIKFKKTNDALNFALRHNLNADAIYRVDFFSSTHYNVADGGMIQEIPHHLVEQVEYTGRKILHG